METKTLKRRKPPIVRIRKSFFIIAIAVAAVFAYTPAAHANTAAGTTITNNVTVNYADAGGQAQTAVSNSVSITVSLVGAVAWGAVPPNADASSGAPLASAYTIQLTNQGNGSDTFTIADGTTEGAGLGGGTFASTPDEDGGTAGTQITLFGTVTSGAGAFGAGVTTIPVSNLTLADLVVGTTQVVIGGSTFTVAAGSSATQLVVTGDASGVANAAGIQIGERATLTFNGTVGTLTVGTASSTHTHNLTATGLSQNGNTAATALSGNWTTTVYNATLTVDKYVRNVGNANGNPAPGSGTTVNGAEYWASGVTGNPGDTLEYAVVISNSNQGLATVVLFQDTLPAFTGLVGGQTAVDTTGDGTYDHPGTTGDTEANDQANGIIETDTGVASTATSLTVYAGTGGDETTNAGGSIAGSSSCIIKYQVTID